MAWKKFSCGQKFIFVYAKIYWRAHGNKLSCRRECGDDGMGGYSSCNSSIPAK